MKSGILIVARCGSTRLPQKHLQPVNGQPIISYLLRRIHQCFRPEIGAGTLCVVVATGDEPENRALEGVVSGLAQVFYGSIRNIPLRELQAAEALGLECIISVDGDDILCSPEGMRAVLGRLQAGAPYVKTEGLPFGMNSFGYTRDFLSQSLGREAASVLETGWGRIFDEQAAQTLTLSGFPKDERLRFSLDYPEDLEFFKALLTELGAGYVSCSDQEIARLVLEKQFFHNAQISEAYWGNFRAQVKEEQHREAAASRPPAGPALWNRAKQIIPGGNQLLSKRSERFLPGLWPAYYQRAKGCEVWDLDGNHYYDFAQMGVGSCILGYADEDVNQAVIKAVQGGSMCTLNCPEEVQLAERLCQLHPWADMVRFARTGGEACAIAIRIARAASGRGSVAFCGYHGWHDWYLAANLADSSNLDGQLLPGLQPAGVPRELRFTALPFQYNDLEGLEKIAREQEGKIGAIIMEPERGTAPAPGFLQGVRVIASRIGAVLIFDEVTSGLRMNLGGIHLIHGVNPDIAVLGKALGNGYPISAVLGRREVMEAAQSSFISSTFWTERIGYVAALATLEKCERTGVPVRLTQCGERINKGWRSLAAKHHIDIHISGIPPLTHLSFVGPNALALQTLYTQEMLAAGYLLGASVYSTYAYTDKIIDGFIAASDPVFGRMSDAWHDPEFTPQKYLKGEVIQTGFARLT